ncbi:MAG: DUF1003 domain-containing protein [Verrucomicrobia bacterium]|nr:DUF1003 domain-containing protein [Verrucomicrobiota bacterium]
MSEPPAPSPRKDHAPDIAAVVDRNIEALIERHKRELRDTPLQDRVAEAITRFTGSMKFVYLHLVVFGFWIIDNVPGVPGPKWDPTFVILAMASSVEAIFLSTFVLITQNRTAAQSDKRSDLNLHISLLSEHEITHLITLVSEIAKKLEVDASKDPQIEELKKDILPEDVLARLDEKKSKAFPPGAEPP